MTDDHHRFGAFCLNGVMSTSYGIILTAPPTEEFAQRDVDMISIPGRSGDLVIDNGGFKNITITYDCAILPIHGADFRDAVINAMNYLRKFSNGYVRLQDVFSPDYYRMAMAANAVSVRSIMDRAGEFKLKLNCKPQRYLCSGDYAHDHTNGSVIFNSSAYAAKPLIKVTGTGSGSVTVGTVTVQIKNMTVAPLYLDCETMNAYRQTGDGAVENANSDIFAPEFPVLRSGDNAVTFSGGVTGITITPRWWTL